MPSRTRWKWGILFGGDNLSMADLLRYGKMADDAGADSVWTAEVWRDAFVPLTAMASVVQRARSARQSHSLRDHPGTQK